MPCRLCRAGVVHQHLPFLARVRHFVPGPGQRCVSAFCAEADLFNLFPCTDQREQVTCPRCLAVLATPQGHQGGPESASP